jgi:ABC-type bacteriocin/lantibiotic exporter with double-glycine peptidase domain
MSLILMVYIGMCLVQKGDMTVGGLTSYVIYALHLSESLRDISQAFSHIS